MKKYLTIILCLVLILSVSVAVYAAGSATMSLSTAGSAVYPGDSFTVTVKLSNTESVSNGGIVLKFDSNIFEITGGSCNISGATGEVKVSRGGGWKVYHFRQYRKPCLYHLWLCRNRIR